MPDQEQLKLLERSVSEWNEWCNMYRGQPNLSAADLRNRRLSGAVFAASNLQEANLSRCSLESASFARSNLIHADFSLADLSDTDFSGACLVFTNFSGCRLAGADFSGAILGETIFNNVDLQNVNGLNSCDHVSPSVLDSRTLERSGRLPETFLRGCGFSDIFIDYIPSLFWGGGIEFYSCFISHSERDKAFARRLHDALQARGIRCWLDEKQIAIGDDLHDEIDRGIKHWDKIILCCSEASLGKSWWVERELGKALNKERDLMKTKGEKVLSILPIDLDGFLFTDGYDAGIKNEILTRKVGDFSNWKEHDAFELALEELMQALRADEGRREPVPVKTGGREIAPEGSLPKKTPLDEFLAKEAPTLGRR